MAGQRGVRCLMSYSLLEGYTAPSRPAHAHAGEKLLKRAYARVGKQQGPLDTAPTRELRSLQSEGVKNAERLCASESGLFIALYRASTHPALHATGRERRR